MKRIPLTQEQFTLVDDEDYDWLNQWKWYAQKVKRGYYAKRDVWKKGKKTCLFMHRLILNAPQGVESDHRDCNGLNNQRYNLRTSTRQQNNRNTRPSLSKSGKYKGTSWDKIKQKWVSQIMLQRKHIHLGRFNTEVEAALVYDEAAKKLFGEFAKTNF